jgi:nitrate/nitrite transporter NarK
MVNIKKISILAIVIGIIVDMVGTMIASSIFTVIFVTTNHLDIHKIKELNINNLYISLSMIIGFIFSILGGFIAARIAKQSKLMHSAVIGIACELLGVYTILAGNSVLPTWYHVMAFIITIPVSMCGGLLAIELKQSKKDIAF